MYIDFWSTLFGAVFTAALILLVNQFYTKVFGGKELRKLRKENRELRSTLNEKDKYIRKSLEELDREVREKQMKEEQE